VSRFCEALMLSRQNYYKTYVHFNQEKLQGTEMIRTEILSILEESPGHSGRHVFTLLKERGIKVGRDKFYQIINDYKLTLNSKKKAWRRSRCKLPAAGNQIKDKTFRRVFEVLFSDYTEINTEEGKLQLLLVEDLVSRFITAYRLHPTCASAPVGEALLESLELKKSLGLKYQTIFHTDRGSEFVNHKVRAIAAEHNLIISNTGKFHCYDNAFMESLNKTLKHSLGLRMKFAGISEAEVCVEKAINTYNYERQHSRIGNLVPYSVLTSYTGKNSGHPGRKEPLCHPAGRVARKYSNSLKVKVKKINVDNIKNNPK